MSENAEIVRRAYDCFNAGDVDGVLELCAPDFEFRDFPDLPGSGVFIGHDAFRGWWATLADAFEDLRFHVDEVIDAGDRIVVVNHATGRGRGSGAEVQMYFTNVWTLSGGKVVSAISYGDHAEALAAGGLS